MRPGWWTLQSWRMIASYGSPENERDRIYHQRVKRPKASTSRLSRALGSVRLIEIHGSSDNGTWQVIKSTDQPGKRAACIGRKKESRKFLWKRDDKKLGSFPASGTNPLDSSTIDSRSSSHLSRWERSKIDKSRCPACARRQSITRGEGPPAGSRY